MVTSEAVRGRAGWALDGLQDQAIGDTVVEHKIDAKTDWFRQAGDLAVAGTVHPAARAGEHPEESGYSTFPGRVAPVAAFHFIRQSLHDLIGYTHIWLSAFGRWISTTGFHPKEKGRKWDRVLA
jgi:hypothetical protein